MLCNLTANQLKVKANKNEKNYEGSFFSAVSSGPLKKIT